MSSSSTEITARNKREGPSEVKLVEATLKAIRIGGWHGAGRSQQKLRRLIADRGYDSDPLRRQLAARGIELIAPHRRKRSKPPTQDGQAPRPSKRRCIVEHTLIYLGNPPLVVDQHYRSLSFYQHFLH